ncbi:MAG: ABC transporter permease [Chitinophagaceae bacterium]|nr:ABC transporter permease [Chitinophagaceae bacterium]
MSYHLSTEVISSKTKFFDVRLKELWHYRDLIGMFVKRDLAATYKQSLLGPLWFFIQPILTSVTFLFVFKKFAGISTNGLPGIVFYLSGITIWNYFAECFTKTATVFKDHSSLFGKVYFPRLIVPLSITISSLIRFGIQFLMFVSVAFYFSFFTNASIHANINVLFTPVLLFIMAGFALGSGMIISALTVKYRDLSYLITFGVQLLMFGTPVIYSVETIDPHYKRIVLLNPLSPIVEAFRFVYLGTGDFSIPNIMYSFIWMTGLFITGVIIFTKVEKTSMDTV